MRVLSALLAVPLILGGVGAHSLELITGTAGYRERIAAPPGAVFEVRLEDVSLMDVPAKVLGKVTVHDAGNPPYVFAIPFNPNVIEEGRRYTVRASLLVDGALHFTTDTHTPVLTGGAGTDVSITMVKVQISSAQSRRIIGEFTYFADAATFSECGSDETYPVAMEGGYLEAERGYLEAREEPMKPTMVVLDGEFAEREGIEGGEREMLVIERIAGFVPGLSCETSIEDAAIEDTYWRILSVGEVILGNQNGGRDPHLSLQSAGGEFTSSVGCNVVNGSYTLDGTSLSIGAGPMTLMACPPPLDEIERLWTTNLSNVAEVIVTGPTMEMRDADGKSVAFLQAVERP